MAKTDQRKNILLKLIIVFTGLLILGFLTAMYILYAPNLKSVKEDTYLYIPDYYSFDQVVEQLKEKAKIANTYTLVFVSKRLKYHTHIRPGRYSITQGMSNFALIRKLRGGAQDPLMLRFNSLRTKEQLAGRLGSLLMADSMSIITLLNDEDYLKKYDLQPNTSMALFIPNTYEVFWNMDANDIFEKMKREYDVFWNESRKAKAAAIPMSQLEVITLASIIQDETNKNFEYPIIAGLYINRLKKKMPLQACPTVKFALGDFALQRILHRHLQVNSPYNTYKYTGLPPGPIRMPSTVCIDAVLNYEKHNYLFMTAKETLDGEHHFAATLAEHNKNARRYQQALNKRGIK